MRAKQINNYLIALFLLLITAACEKDLSNESLIDRDQLAVEQLSGTWGRPFNVQTPGTVPPEIFGNIRLLFLTDASGNPTEFLASDCPIIFNNEQSHWSTSTTDSGIQIKLSEVGPVDNFSAILDGTTLTLSFYMGWENTETGATGAGDFQVSLSRL